MIYKWKICCIKIVTTIGEEFLKAYGFDAANQMSSSIGSRAVTDIVTGTDSSWQNYVGDGVVEGVLGKVGDKITKGRGNYAAVFKGGLTKSMTDNIKEKLQKDDTEKE